MSWNSFLQEVRVPHSVKSLLDVKEGSNYILLLLQGF